MGVMTLDQFLGHKPRGGSRNKYANWKDDGSITVWVHPAAEVIARWAGRWHRVEVVEREGVKRREVWGMTCPSIEDETILKERWRVRDQGTLTAPGEREVPYQRDPICLMTEAVRRLVVEGRIKWTDPVFHFAGDDPAKAVWLHAGGLYGAFGNKKLTEEHKREMREIPASRGGPVYQGGDSGNVAFKQNVLPKCEYIFTIVNHAKPEDGIILAIEPAGLGEKFQDVIAKAIKELGDEEGLPSRNPVAFEFTKDKTKGIAFDRVYDVTRLSKLKMTPAVQKLLREPPPDNRSLLDPPVFATLRANMEKHCLLERGMLDWDAIFGPAEQWAKQHGQRAHQQREEQAPEVGRPQPAVAPQAQQAWDGRGPDLFGCDACGQAMRADEDVCPHCGHSYVVHKEPEKAAPPPALPKRSSLNAGGAPARQPEPPAADDIDDIPF